MPGDLLPDAAPSPWKVPLVAETVASQRLDDDDFVGNHHVYQPFRAGLPRMGPYLRELWRRKSFAAEASRATLRGAQANTVFGQLWNVLNPLLLGSVYYLLIYVLAGSTATRPEYFAHLLCGLFLFYFVAGSMNGGAQSVTGAGRMIVNIAFPRLLLPLSSVRTAFRRFLPTLLVLLVAIVVGPVKLAPVMLLAIPWFIFPLLFATGMAALLATAQVYFRDTSSFLPYFTRIWLYISPVLWFADQVPSKLRIIEWLNPLFSIVGGWSEIMIQHRVPTTATWLTAAAWSIGVFIVGCVTFMSRERDFAVRL